VGGDVEAAAVTEGEPTEKICAVRAI
jgi:hypothetical protein